MRHLLVTNDFPPKVGGIQSYLWELWRRLPPDSFSVLTTPYHDDRMWDLQQPFEVRRTKQWWLLPTRDLVRQVNNVVRNTEADFVVLDPVVPLGLIGSRLDVPYVAIAHGAEYVIPGRTPATKPFVSKVTKQSSGMIACGAYVEESVKSILGPNAPQSVVSIPPGVDTERFKPLTREARESAREHFGVADDAQLVVGVSRLVPRKGFDRLIKAAAKLKATHPKLQVLIAGKGREKRRLEALIEKLDAPVRMLGRVADEDLQPLYGCADAFAMACHDRWLGLESEGFGIVFCEAAAMGVPVVAGRSGGSSEAVADGETGYVVDGRVSADDVASALAKVLADAEVSRKMGERGRERTVELFSYDRLAADLEKFLGSIVIG